MYDNQQQGGFKGGKNTQQFGGPKQMFSAICADCRKSCQVPFRPSGDKPIYCKECFLKRKEKTAGDSWRADAPSGNVSKQSFAPTNPQVSSSQLNDLKRQLDAINVKLDTLLRKESEATVPKTRKPATKNLSAKKLRKAVKSRK